MSDELLEELDQLLRDMLDGEWDEFKQHRLNEILRESGDARRHYRETMQLHAILRAKGRGATAPLSLPLDEISAPPRLKKLSLFKPYLGWAAAAMLILVMTIKMVYRDQDVAIQKPVDELSKPDANISRLLEVSWAPSTKVYKTGDALSGEWVEFSSGVMQVDFQNGARMIIEGPARMRVESALSCFVGRGKLTVLAEGEAAGFVLHTPNSKVMDLGTEFGVEIQADGKMDVQVLQGRVEVTLNESKTRKADRKELVANEAVLADPANGIQTATFSPNRYERLRAESLRKSQPLHLQFDCGIRAGVYQGTEAPAHAAGDFLPQEKFWNAIVGNQKGQMVATDGKLLPFDLSVEVGQNSLASTEMDWNSPIVIPDYVRTTRGVFRTPLGMDGINGGRQVGMRIHGLPSGTYRVFLLGHNPLVHKNWGNFLADKAYKCWIGVSEKGTRYLIDPLTDQDALHWVAGQTHVIAEVTIKETSDYLQFIVERDPERSPVPKGGNAMILGVQIMQIKN